MLVHLACLRDSHLSSNRNTRFIFARGTSRNRSAITSKISKKVDDRSDDVTKPARFRNRFQETLVNVWKLPLENKVATLVAFIALWFIVPRVFVIGVVGVERLIVSGLIALEEILLAALKFTLTSGAAFGVLVLAIAWFYSKLSKKRT